VSTEENAQLRERRANDAEYRARENETKRRYMLRKKAALTGAPIPEGAALVRRKPEDPTERWLQLWLALNRSESIREEERARKRVKEEMETLLTSGAEERRPSSAVCPSLFCRVGRRLFGSKPR
jgi:hypothetical protein